MIEPELCRSMAEVRASIDELDDEIVRLLAKRFRFMDAAARIKDAREQVRDEARKLEVIERAGRRAREAGAPEKVISRLYDELVEASISYEFDKFDDRRRA